MDFTNPFPSNNSVSNGGLNAFDSIEAAPEFTPLPPGVYNARVAKGGVVATKNGADAYRMYFAVVDGPHAGRTVVRLWTFGPRALPYTKRDLSVFGLTTSQKLLAPFPEPGREYHCRLTVAVQRDDNGIERNDIKRIEVVRISDSPIAEFVLPPKGSEGGLQ